MSGKEAVRRYRESNKGIAQEKKVLELSCVGVGFTVCLCLILLVDYFHNVTLNSLGMATDLFKWCMNMTYFATLMLLGLFFDVKKLFIVFSVPVFSDLLGISFLANGLGWDETFVIDCIYALTLALFTFVHRKYVFNFWQDDDSLTTNDIFEYSVYLILAYYMLYSNFKSVYQLQHTDTLLVYSVLLVLILVNIIVSVNQKNHRLEIKQNERDELYGDWLVTGDWDIRAVNDSLQLNGDKVKYKGKYWLELMDYNIALTEEQLHSLVLFRQLSKDKLIAVNLNNSEILAYNDED